KEANIIFGWVSDPAMEGQVRVTVLATGFAHRPPQQVHAAASGAVQPAPQAQPSSPRPLDTPALHRQQPAQAQPGAPQPGQPTHPAPPPSFRTEAPREDPSVQTANNENDLDIPAFLRRR